MPYPMHQLPHLIIDGGTLKYVGSGSSTNRHFALGAGLARTINALGHRMQLNINELVGDAAFRTGRARVI